jgi:hypothetical protein
MICGICLCLHLALFPGGPLFRVLKIHCDLSSFVISQWNRGINATAGHRRVYAAKVHLLPVNK